MQALLKIFAVVLALFPLLTWAAPVSVGVCEYTDRIATALCIPTITTINRSGTFANFCNLSYMYRQSMITYARTLNESMIAQTPVAERDYVGHMPVDPELPTSFQGTQMDSLMNGLAKYELEMFCVGQALATLEVFKRTNHSAAHLCPLLTRGKQTACLAREDFDTVANGSWMENRSVCGHFSWPGLMNESASFWTNLYSISVVRRYHQYLSSWQQACPAA